MNATALGYGIHMIFLNGEAKDHFNDLKPRLTTLATEENMQSLLSCVVSLSLLTMLLQSRHSSLMTLSGSLENITGTSHHEHLLCEVIAVALYVLFTR